MMETGLALVALTLMEIILGIDNIVFITIVTGRLPESQQPLARKLGLLLALGMRLLLLLTLSYIVQHLTAPLFELTSLGIPESLIERFGGHGQDKAEAFAESNGISWRDLILLAGGFFLIGKSVHEIHDEVNHDDDAHHGTKSVSFTGVLVQIALLDVIFSLDSVITAVGMVDEVSIMATAIILAVVAMIIFAEPINRFVSKNPTLKLLALSFLILIGVVLVSEGIGAHIDKGYVYFAMFFALFMEFLNMRMRKKRSNRSAKAATGVIAFALLINSCTALNAQVNNPADFGTKNFTNSQELNALPGTHNAISVELDDGYQSQLWLYTPQTQTDEHQGGADEMSALLLFLHGGGEGGQDIKLVKKHGPPREIENGRSLPFYVASPRNPSQTQFWDDQMLIRLVDRLQHDLELDPDRIYLAGMSRGAFGAWRLAIQNPDRFAALIAVCGGGDLPYLKRIRHLPIWCFHGLKDDVIPFSESERLVQELKELGNDVRFTVYPEADHDAWTQTFANPDIYQWLVQQRRKTQR